MKYNIIYDCFYDTILIGIFRYIWFVLFVLLTIQNIIRYISHLLNRIYATECIHMSCKEYLLFLFLGFHDEFKYFSIEYYLHACACMPARKKPNAYSCVQYTSLKSIKISISRHIYSLKIDFKYCGCCTFL